MDNELYEKEYSELPPFKDRSFKQHLGFIIATGAALIGIVGVSSLTSLVEDFSIRRLFLAILFIIFGISVNSFGRWFYTPKNTRGKYKIFYDPPSLREIRDRSLGRKPKDKRTIPLKEEVMELFGPRINKMEKKGDIEGLSQALRHESNSIREKAAFALDRLAWKPQDEVNKAWYFAAKRNWQELAEVGEPALFPLVLALRHPEEGIRIVAGDTLEKIALSNTDSAVPLLCEALTNHLIDFNPNITQARNRTVGILGKMGDERAVLPLSRSLDNVRDRDYKLQERSQVPFAKRKYPHYEAYRDLVKQAIKEIGEPAITPLIEALSSDKIEIWNKVSFPDMLSFIGSPAVDPLIELLDDENEEVRSAAISALGRIDDDRIFDILVKSLRDNNGEFRMDAIRAMGQRDDNRIMEHMVEALRDNYYGVRTNAAGYLKKKSWQPSNAEEKAYFLLVDFLLSISGEGAINKTKRKELVNMGEQAVNPLVRSLDLEGSGTYLYNTYKGKKVVKIPYRQYVRGLLIDIGKPSIPALEKALENPDPIFQIKAQEVLNDLYKKRGSAIRPVAPRSTAEPVKSKRKWGFVLTTCGSLILAVGLIFIAAIVFSLFNPDSVGDAPGVVLGRMVICALPILIIGFVLLFFGISKLRSQKKQPPKMMD